MTNEGVKVNTTLGSKAGPRFKVQLAEQVEKGAEVQFMLFNLGTQADCYLGLLQVGERGGMDR